MVDFSIILITHILESREDEITLRKLDRLTPLKFCNGMAGMSQKLQNKNISEEALY